MMEGCWVYMKNLTFSSFSRLMEVARRTNEIFRRTSRSNRLLDLHQKEINNRGCRKKNGAKACSSQKVLIGKKETRLYLVLSHFLCRAKRVEALLEQ